MILIACVDDNMGMMFNKRRQSQDRAVRQDILREVGEGVLWMNAYSYKQFAQGQGLSSAEDSRIRVDEDFFHQAGEKDWCFIENISPTPYESSLSKILLYKWNRKYPADMRFDMSLEEQGWKPVSIQEFPGYSHEKITKVVYAK